MRKFNVDEFIWFIVLGILLFLMIYLQYSGQILNFINNSMIIYFYLSIIIVGLFLVGQFYKIFTVKSRIEVTNRFIPLIFTLFIIVIFLFGLPVYKNIKGETTEDIAELKVDGAILITNENYEILNEMDSNLNTYLEKNIQLVAYVNSIDKNNNEVVLAREEVSCCQGDKRLIKIRVKGLNEDVKIGTWINVAGKVKADSQWYLEAIDASETKEPKELYFHHS